MLSVRVICVGKLGEKFWKQACDEYVKRLQGYCRPEVSELPEQKLPDTPSSGQIAAALKKESALIREKIPQEIDVKLLPKGGSFGFRNGFTDGNLVFH